MSRLVRLHLTTGLIALAVAGQAMALSPQDAVGDLLAGQATVNAQAAPRQDPAEVRTTQALNAEIVAQNDLAAGQEQADQQAYVAAQAEVDAETQSTSSADQARYEADLAAHAEAQARYEAAMADWRATAAACQRGDTRRCRAGAQPAIPVGY